MEEGSSFFLMFVSLLRFLFVFYEKYAIVAVKFNFFNWAGRQASYKVSILLEFKF